MRNPACFFDFLGSALMRMLQDSFMKVALSDHLNKANDAKGPSSPGMSETLLEPQDDGKYQAASRMARFDAGKRLGSRARVGLVFRGNDRYQGQYYSIGPIRPSVMGRLRRGPHAA